MELTQNNQIQRGTVIVEGSALKKEIKGMAIRFLFDLYKH